MKVFVYSCRRFDEEPMYLTYAEEMGMEVSMTEDAPTLENASMAEGCDFISVLTTKVSADMIDRYKSMGIKLLCTRTIGYDHIDVEHARRIGLPVAHVTYDPSGVAEYTVMMMLMALRKYREMEALDMRNDFRLKGLLGKEIGKCTVGIIGAGNIGRMVLRDLSGFGGRLLYYNRSPSPEADRYAEKVSLNELLAQSDIVSLHLEHNVDTHHKIDASAIARMKDGAILINTARGPLVDTEALISALESGKLGGAAIDVVENEIGLCYNDCSDRDLDNHFIGRLRALPNVHYMHHMAFYYESAIRDMVVNSLIAMKAAYEGKDIPLRL